MRQLNTIFKREEDLLAIRDKIASHPPQQTLIQVFCGGLGREAAEQLRVKLTEFFPGTAIIGASSAGEIVDAKVLEHSTAICVSLFDHTRVQTRQLNQNCNSIAAGQTISDAHGINDPKAAIVFGCGLNHGNFKDNFNFLESLSKTLGGISLAGGQAGGYEGQNSRTFAFTEHYFLEEGFIGAFLSGEKLCVHMDYDLGWVPLGKRMTVTHAQGNRIYSIEGKPTEEIYNQYLGIEPKKSPIHIINSFPLMIYRDGIRTTNPISTINHDGSLELIQEVNTGEQVQFSFCDATLQEEGAQRLCEIIGKHKPDAVFAYSCASRKALFGEEVTIDMDALRCCNNSAGFFTFGEYYTSPNQRPYLFLQTMTVMTLSETDSCHSEICQQSPAEHNKSGADLRKFQLMKVMSHLVTSTTKELEDSNRELAELANKDGLTGLANRRLFDETLQTRLKEYSRTLAPLSIILMDVDFFKQFNDTYGHVAGDDCLRGVAQILQRETKRPSDMAFRYGGEEFACVLAFTDHAGAMQVAENIRLGVEGLAIAHERSTASQFVTISLGVLTMSGGNAPAPQELLNTCDELLYSAKENGRNQVVGRELSHQPDTA